MDGSKSPVSGGGDKVYYTPQQAQEGVEKAKDEVVELKKAPTQLENRTKELGTKLFEAIKEHRKDPEITPAIKKMLKNAEGTHVKELKKQGSDIRKNDIKDLKSSISETKDFVSGTLFSRGKLKEVSDLKSDVRGKSEEIRNKEEKIFLKERINPDSKKLERYKTEKESLEQERDALIEKTGDKATRVDKEINDIKTDIGKIDTKLESAETLERTNANQVTNRKAFLKEVHGKIEDLNTDLERLSTNYEIKKSKLLEERPREAMHRSDREAYKKELSNFKEQIKELEKLEKAIGKEKIGDVGAEDAFLEKSEKSIEKILDQCKDIAGKASFKLDKVESRGLYLRDRIGINFRNIFNHNQEISKKEINFGKDLINNKISKLEEAEKQHINAIAKTYDMDAPFETYVSISNSMPSPQNEEAQAVTESESFNNVEESPVEGDSNSMKSFATSMNNYIENEVLGDSAYPLSDKKISLTDAKTQLENMVNSSGDEIKEILTPVLNRATESLNEVDYAEKMQDFIANVSGPTGEKAIALTAAKNALESRIEENGGDIEKILAPVLEQAINSLRATTAQESDSINQSFADEMQNYADQMQTHVANISGTHEEKLERLTDAKKSLENEIGKEDENIKNILRPVLEQTISALNEMKISLKEAEEFATRVENFMIQVSEAEITNSEKIDHLKTTKKNLEANINNNDQEVKDILEPTLENLDFVMIDTLKNEIYKIEQSSVPNDEKLNELKTLRSSIEMMPEAVEVVNTAINKAIKLSAVKNEFHTSEQSSQKQLHTAGKALEMIINNERSNKRNIDKLIIDTQISYQVLGNLSLKLENEFGKAKTLKDVASIYASKDFEKYATLTAEVVVNYTDFNKKIETCLKDPANENFKTDLNKYINTETNLNTIFDVLSPAIQRLPRHEMLLKEVLKEVNQLSDEGKEVLKAVNLAAKAASHVNEAKRKSEETEMLSSNADEYKELASMINKAVDQDKILILKDNKIEIVKKDSENVNSPEREKAAKKALVDLHMLYRNKNHDNMKQVGLQFDIDNLVKKFINHNEDIREKILPPDNAFEKNPGFKALLQPELKSPQQMKYEQALEFERQKKEQKKTI